MTIKERKLMLHFLELLEQTLENRKVNEINPVFLKLFSRKELIQIALWLYENYDRSMLTDKTELELLELIGDDSCVLSYVIEQWKNSINAVPQITQEQVSKLFDELQVNIHYLRHKPVKEWDDYDVSNYYSMLLKLGKTKRVYAIYAADVKDEDKYIVTTEPSLFFDTKQEAEEELERFCMETKQSEKNFTIHTLWKLN